MITSNLTIPHEVVAITDMAEGIEPWIKLVPLWDDLADRGRCFRRLKLFDPETARSIGERIAWMDLDCVVVGDLDPLFDRDEDLVLWRSQTTRGAYNGSMVLMTAGEHPEVWEDYSPSIQLRSPGSDQAVLEHILGPNMPVWTEADGVHAYNRRPRRWRDGPKESARVVFFPGSIKSNSHIVMRQTPWVQEILNEYGDFDEKPYRWHPRAHRAISRRQARFARGSRQGVMGRE